MLCETGEFVWLLRLLAFSARGAYAVRREVCGKWVKERACEQERGAEAQGRTCGMGEKGRQENTELCDKRT